MSETNLGSEIKRRRAPRSLQQLAAETGISAATISRIETGQIELPSRETLDALSRALGVPLPYLAQLAYCGSPRVVEDTPPTRALAPA